MGSVAELKENLVDMISGLGINLEFFDNPGYVGAMEAISNIINQIDIEDPSVVLIVEDEGKISFEYVSNMSDKYTLEITCYDPNTIRCIKVEELHSFVGDNKQVVRRKNVVEEIVKLEQTGELVLYTNYGSIDNIGCENNVSYNMTSSVDRCVYNIDGVMKEREHKDYGTRKGEGYFHRVGSKEMLLLARQAFVYGPWADIYQKRVLLVREMLDTARISYEDRSKNYSYYGIIPLSQKDGLRDMKIKEEYNTFPIKSVEINPITEEEISAMLEREKNPRVALGLKGYVNGRTTYHYRHDEEDNN